MKLYKLLCTALCLGFLTSACNDSFLDEDKNPNALSPGSFWKSESDIMKGLTSVYGSFQNTTAWGSYIVIDNYRSDETDFKPDVGSWDAIASFLNDQYNGTSSSEWSKLYRGISLANQCIDNIPLVPGESASLENLKKVALAEARFLRAYFYYRLYLNFGEKIPIYTTQIKGSEEEYFPPQAEPGKLVKLIEDELIAVQPDLLDSHDKNNKGRITSYAAAAVLGKFYMFRHELGKAEKEFAKLIGKFQLMENFEHNYDGLHKNNAESVLEAQYSGDQTGGRSESHAYAQHLLTNVIGGYEEAKPTRWLFELLKKDITVDGKYSQRLYGTILFDDPETKVWYLDEGEKFSDYESPERILWKKFTSWHESLSAHWWISAFNIPIIRYADILLLYAECLNDRGETAQAVQYINEVRRRARVPELPETMSKEAILKHLQDVERPCELAFEGCRWYDLVRWGIVEKTLKDHNKRFVENYIDSKHQLLPIPSGEFDMNPGWEQNPNFGK